MTTSILSLDCDSAVIWGKPWITAVTGLIDRFELSPATVEPNSFHGATVSAGSVNQHTVIGNGKGGVAVAGSISGKAYILCYTEWFAVEFQARCVESLPIKVACLTNTM